MKATCPCCGYKTLLKPRNWEICDLCFWEDDPYQFVNPDFGGGMNEKSLRAYQEEFRMGAYPHRKPTCFDERDPYWRPIEERMQA